MQTYNLTKILRPYASKKLWVALTPDYNKVAGSGKTPKIALQQAQKRGVKNPAIIRAISDYSGFAPAI